MKHELLERADQAGSVGLFFKPIMESDPHGSIALAPVAEDGKIFRYGEIDNIDSKV